MTRSDIPGDSLLHHWCDYLSATEVPYSYQVAAGLTTLGALLRRQRWIDQVEWRVYPNQSTLFVGPSGIGKDTIINRSQRLVESFENLSRVPILGGKTMEAISAQMATLNKPACAYIPAAEMTAFFGKADYQQNLVTGMTDLLSTGEKLDITTKGSYNLKQGASTYIYQPTITMHGGSTVEWLHKQMPDGTMEGGFLGRFLIVCEEFGGRFIPLVKSASSKQRLQALRTTLEHWNMGVEAILKECATPHEVILLEDAEAAYTNWYYNRFRYFSKVVTPYANRSRDMVLRLAMLMGMTRGHYRWIDQADIEFAISMLHQVAAKIDKVVLPPTTEAEVAAKILELLPAMASELYSALAVKYQSKTIEAALNLLVVSKKARVDRQRGLYSRIEETK